MKKRMLLLVCCVCLLASCENNNNTSVQAAQKAQIDSIATAKATLRDIANQKRNDSTINAIATAKADSIRKTEPKDKPQPAPVKTTKDTLTTETK